METHKNCLDEGAKKKHGKLLKDELFQRIFFQTINSVIKSKSLFHLVVWMTTSQKLKEQLKRRKLFWNLITFLLRSVCYKRKICAECQQSFFPTLSLVKRIFCCFFLYVIQWNLSLKNVKRKTLWKANIITKARSFPFVFFSPCLFP